MSAQREEQACEIGDDQDEGNRSRDVLDVAAERVALLGELREPGVPGDAEHRRQQQRDDRQQQHPRLGLRGGARERLTAAAPAAREHRRSQDEQAVAEDRAHERGLHDLLQSVAQREQRDDQLGSVAEGDVHEASHAGPGARGELLRGVAHQRRGGHDRERARDEHERRRRFGGPQGERHGDERAERVDRPHRGPAAGSTSAEGCSRPCSNSTSTATSSVAVRRSSPVPGLRA